MSVNDDSDEASQLFRKRESSMRRRSSGKKKGFCDLNNKHSIEYERRERPAAERGERLMGLDKPTHMCGVSVAHQSVGSARVLFSHAVVSS